MPEPEARESADDGQVAERGHQIRENIFLVSWLGMTPDNIDCSVYVLRREDGLLLIDCGTPWGHERICRNCEHWGLDLTRPKAILLTHGHVDHARGGYLFKRKGAEILAHAEAARTAEAEWAACLRDEGSSEVFRVDKFLSEGDHLQRFGFEATVFHTPGHTVGCLSYLIEVDGEKCLFTGDLVMGNGLPGWRGDPGHSEEQLLAHLERLAELDFDHLLYGHGHLLNDRGELFRRALAKHDCGEWDE